MLYPVGTHLSVTPDPASGVGIYDSDTDGILAVWGEALEVKRPAKTPTATGMTQVWTTVVAFIGDWQPVSGKTMTREEGRNVKSNSQVFAALGLNVQEGDRIYKADGTFEYVNYILKFEDHLQIMLTVSIGSN